jgi:hypothetical protein
MHTGCTKTNQIVREFIAKRKRPSRVKEGPVGTSDGSIFVTNHGSLISAAGYVTFQY